jgi:hypothetical protein
MQIPGCIHEDIAAQKQADPKDPPTEFGQGHSVENNLSLWVKRRDDNYCNSLRSMQMAF